MNAKARRAELSRMIDGTNYSYRYKTQLAIAASVEYCIRERINIIQLGTVLINSTDRPQKPYVRCLLYTSPSPRDS